MATGPEAPSGFDKDKFIGTVDLEMEVGHKVELFNNASGIKSAWGMKRKKAEKSGKKRKKAGKKSFESGSRRRWKAVAGRQYYAQTNKLRLTQTCYAKCIPGRYKEGELNIGECSCVDRCVAKYSQVTAIIGRVLSSGRPHI